MKMEITPIQFRHKGEPRKVLETALNTLGLRFDYLEKKVGAGHNWNEPSLDAWWSACKFLYLDPELAFSCGYAYELHKGRISNSLKEDGEKYRHPKTKAFKKVLREIKRSWSNELNMYGKRLRWQIRINRALGTNFVIPTYEDIVPSFIRRIIHKIKKNWAMKAHLAKHGNLEDFVYYNAEFDPLEERRSGYFSQLANSGRTLAPVAPTSPPSPRRL